MHRRAGSSSAAEVRDQLFRALAVLRVVLLVNAVALNLYRADNFRERGALVLCLAVMVGWTAVALWAYADPHRRTHALLAADLAVTVALLLASPMVKGPDFNASVPGFWTMGALLAWAVQLRVAGGLAAGVVLASVDLAVRAGVDQAAYGNAFLLVIGGPVVGYMCASLQRMAEERERAEQSAAAAAERARLARVVHDGVLQVLALVQRRGHEMGGEMAELGRLAAEQERQLRGMVQREASSGPATGTVRADGETTGDLAAALGALEHGPQVTVATPATPVDMPRETVSELVAAVRACLDNVTRHVGPAAPAWVLLEAFADRVEVSVRDAGPGIAPGRLDEARAEGRLGVAESISGRLAALGGTAEVTTDPAGTEWTLTVPRRARP